MSPISSLHEKRPLFEAQLPAELQQGLRIAGCTAKHWRLAVSGSKSMTNRAIVLAALSGRPLLIHAPLLADDTWWGFLALAQLGFELDVNSLPESIGIRPPPRVKNPAHANIPHGALIHVGQAGTLARFLPAALLNWQRVFPQSMFTHFEISADGQLARRPLQPLLDALRELGGRVSAGESAFPLRVDASQLAGRCRIDGSQSGQFLSGLLMAAAGSRNDCRIERIHALVQPDYVRMTLQMLADFGARIACDDALTHFHVQAGAWSPPPHYTIEADASTACYYAALACVFGIDLQVENLGSATLQPDFEFISILEKFGFECAAQANSFSVFGSRGRRSVSTALRLDMSRCSDQALTVGVMSIVSGVAAEVHGISHIRHHESNRIAAFCSNCAALGIAVEELSDGFRVAPPVQSEQLQGDWPTHHDHRFALSGCVLAAAARGVRVLEPQSMKKTAPAFVAHLQQLDVHFQS